ncbi:MAG TPA: hypothetical protein DDZ36_03455, partial [Deltaproteobacteria bacterium]|nr:hypothetical protein [Deltaproteobacteria bacterium]
MSRKLYLIAMIGILIFFKSHVLAVTLSADLKTLEAETLPLASFLFAQLDPMRVGWHNKPNGNEFKDLQ